VALIHLVLLKNKPTTFCYNWRISLHSVSITGFNKKHTSIFTTFTPFKVSVYNQNLISSVFSYFLNKVQTQPQKCIYNWIKRTTQTYFIMGPPTLVHSLKKQKIFIIISDQLKTTIYGYLILTLRYKQMQHCTSSFCFYTIFLVSVCFKFIKKVLKQSKWGRINCFSFFANTTFKF
jgi:hypothetical protein